MLAYSKISSVSAVLVVVALSLAALSLTGVASANGDDRSWLDDDVTDTYSRGALMYLDDPTGGGLSVYGNPYVFYRDGTSFKSKWKNEGAKEGWYWESGTAGSWSYSNDDTFVTYRLSSPPTYVYVGRQPITYEDYMASPFTADDNVLWVQGQQSWSRRVVAPLGSYVWLLAYTPIGGQAQVYKLRPDGSASVVSSSILGGYNHMSFYAESLGRHLVTFVKDDQPSNSVIIDVV